MVGLTHGKRGNGAEHIPRLMSGNPGGSNVRKLNSGSRKPANRDQLGANSTHAELHMLPTAKVKKQTPEQSEKIAKALMDDGDPGKLLTEVRDVLFGPTRKLQEARLEELVVILEQLDRETQVAHQGFAEKIKNLESVDSQHTHDVLAVNQRAESFAGQQERDLAALHKKIDLLAVRMGQEMQRIGEIHKRELDEQTEVFVSKLERLSAQVYEHVGEMADHQRVSTQAMATEFSAQLRELSLSAKTNDEKILAHIDARVTQLKTEVDDEKFRSLRILKEGLNGLSERLQSL